VIGEPVTVEAIENVGYWHQAHSFVRGNWRNDEIESPMILQKCCHDFDILSWLLDKKCLSVSSLGSLKYFKKENAPEGSAERCCDCKYAHSCPYSAYRIYFESKEMGYDHGNRDWPLNILTENPDRKSLNEAIEKGPYGRCAFACDNDAVDHQLTQMTFENGVKAELLITAFTAKGGRIYKFFGTLGEMVLNEEEDEITVKPFGGEVRVIPIKPLIEGGYGHGGGDSGLIAQLYDILTGKGTNETTLEASVESHLMGICAEQSRLAGGKLVYLH